MLAYLVLLPLSVPPSAPDQAVRERVVLDTGWRFKLGAAPAAAMADFDDAAWESVAIPHTWNARDGQDGGGDYHRGVAWYRYRLPVLPGDGERRFFLRFNAVSTVADVYIDGRHLGQHRGAFGAFCFEVTPDVTESEGTNGHFVAVRVDNRPVEDVPPLSGDFTIFGGIYRDVELLTTGPVCISPLDYASSGVYLTQTAVSADRAIIDARVVISNSRLSATPAELVVTALDADAHEVAHARREVLLPAASTTTTVARVQIDRPQLWQGRARPYLYTLRAELRIDGQTADRLDQPLGLRTCRVDARDGFFLNGRPLDLHGVNRHQDRQDQGWAISRADMAEDFAILRELGCSAVRLAHYQHDEYAYALADREGLIVWAEIPLVDCITDSPAFRANCRQQLLELIRQNYNHPSICFWGIHNEVTAPWRPGPDPADLVCELHELAKSEDPQRLTVCAAADPEEHPANWQTDLTAFNRYFGWYVGTPGEFGGWADRMHALHRETPLGVSKYGAGASLQHSQWPPTKPQHDGVFHPQEWQAYLHQQHWRAMQQRPYLWCKLIWNGFDFASDGRDEGEAPGRNDKGLVTYDRRARKEAFYWYQANWSDAPMVHIACPSPEDRESGAPIRVYSNCDTVTLYVDECEVGARSVEEHVAQWDVPLSAAAQSLRAVGRHGAASAETSYVAPGRR